LTKQLRLAVGELTDVGRRRERNQDNVTHFVPDDEDVLSRRGALFVVCDGMGGHAAGEIASEIAVKTIRDVYFEERDEDVVTALSRAVRAANAAIYEHAREHQTHSGMGTTCVALALVGGRGFFANVGDSRAYVVRDGVMRQVTLDHSWVAEQVRAGILTDQQARVHAHRNVITRSLGTQPEVVADLFIEDMREGDRVLLCSDGLHGYVAEQEIVHTIRQMEPDETARHLIDLANANGGPDNITAVVVRLLEVPEITGALNLPQTIKLARDRVAIPDMPTQPPMTEAAVALRRGAGTGVLTRATADVDVPAALTTTHASSSGVRAVPAARSRGRLPVVALRLLAVAALLLLVGGMWDVVSGPYAAGRAANDQALHDIAFAEAVASAAGSKSPPAALATLATAQQALKRDLTALPLDAKGLSLVNHALDHVIAPAVRQTLQTYDEQNLITNLPASAISTYTVTCASGTFVGGLQTLAAVGPHAAPAGQIAASVNLYALTGTGALYALSLSSATEMVTCGSAPLIGGNVRAVTSDESQLYALVEQGNTRQVLQVGPDCKTTQKINQPVPPGVSPGALAVHGGDYYVAFSGSAPASPGIWHFNGDLKKPQTTIAVPSAVNGLTVAADGTPFALLADGTLASFDASGHATTAPIAIAPLVAAADPNSYVASTPVPTVPPTVQPSPTAAVTPSAAAGATSTAVNGSLAPDVTPTAAAVPSTTSTPALTPTATIPPTPTATTSQQPSPGATPTLFTGASGFAADRAASGSLVVGDGASARVVRFGVSGAVLQALRQYVYGAPLSALQSVTISPDGTQLFAWSGAHLVQVMLPS
jgi:serine/threonine protein phosphatase PrpC